ncbi:hypothetical protein ABT263_04705 [Kitasatospora sp. NPDC001603]|uniref:hypothetical protein n=1 Tax=Kitasatospora sp. NPDC001603 TaxID=3154388 RepID=UPI00331FDB2D
MTRIEQHRSENGQGNDDRTGHGRVHHAADPRHAGTHAGGRSGHPRHAAGHGPAPATDGTAERSEDRPDVASLQKFPAVRPAEPDAAPAPDAVPAAPTAPPAPGAAAPTAPTGETVAPTAPAAPGRPAAGLGPWLDTTAVQEARAEWERAQIAFVDDPAGSAAAADSLVSRTADLVAEAARRRLEDLREGCRTPDEEPGARTEQLRLAMRDYRAVLDRLLA